MLSVHIPKAQEGSLVRSFKLMKRNVFAHAIVNLGVHLTFNTNATVKSARVILGAATSTIILAGEAMC